MDRAVIQDHDRTGPKLRHEFLSDERLKRQGIDRTQPTPLREQSLQTNRPNHRDIFPFAVGFLPIGALPREGSCQLTDKGQIHTRFIQENQIFDGDAF